MPEKKPSLAMKMLLISEEMGRLPKNGYNSFHKYNYVLESDAVDRFRELCIKHKVMTYPETTSLEQHGDITSLMINWHVCDAESSETITVPMPGYGQDKGDKGPYKAITGSNKYFILKTFNVPTGDDPERDENTTQKPSEARRRANRQEPTQSTSKEETGLKDQILVALVDITDDVNDHADILEMVSEFVDKGVLKSKGARSVDDLSYEVRAGRKWSQAQFVLKKLEDSEAVKEQLIEWRKNR